MTKLGQLHTGEQIEKAMRVIREWLNKIDVNGLTINTNYDARLNIAVLRFNHNGKNYEFRSTKQSNSRLNMWGIARVMEYKVRSQLMGIEDFAKSMEAYIQIEDKSGIPNDFKQVDINDKFYVILGISKTASNEEIKKRYKELTKTFHPDMYLSEESKKEAEKRFAEINEAYDLISKERGIE